jgi:hypothetical protein
MRSSAGIPGFSLPATGHKHEISLYLFLTLTQKYNDQEITNPANGLKIN